MLQLFSLIFIRNIRPGLILFLVILLASTGFLVMRELTENISRLVARETQPIFGADVRVSPRSYTPDPILDSVAPYLSGVAYSYAERTEFSTTLIDRDGKIGLIEVVAYTGDYPQKGILKMTSLTGVVVSSGGYTAATSELIDRFSSGNSITLDTIRVPISQRIVESSDLGFSFGQENNLLILPRSALSGSMLISSGSRLSQDLLLSFSGGIDTDRIVATLRDTPSLSGSRIRSYNERSEQVFDVTRELTNYILLILVVAAIFAGIILRSAHESLFADLSNTLRIFEILGLSRRKQAIIFILLYSCIIPVAFALAIGLSYGIILSIGSIPAASDFVFLLSPITFTAEIIALLLVTSFAPLWIERLGIGSALYAKIPKKISEPLSKYLSISGVILFLGIWGIVYIIFSELGWSSLVVLAGLLALLTLGWILRGVYLRIYDLSRGLRQGQFALFDGVRALVRPLTPTIPITLSLISITSFLVFFILFSLAFRERLTLDVRDTANIYAVNILESDRAGISPVLSGAEIYSVLRSRISRVNGRTLEEHLDDPSPSGEYTREFNITTNILTFPILRGHSDLAADEVSVDDEFSQQLGVDIGDTIEFGLSGKMITLRVANIRKSVREGFRPFFYFSFQEEAFRTAPRTYFVSAYTTDTESWKKSILSRTGPHVTFIDVENILSIVRDISYRILSVISLFFIAVSLFAILAILSLFARLRLVESTKRRLYTLFGATDVTTRGSFQMTRSTILALSYICSIVIGTLLWLYVIRSNTFLSFQFSSLVLASVSIAIAYIILAWVIRPRPATSNR